MELLLKYFCLQSSKYPSILNNNCCRETYQQWYDYMLLEDTIQID